MLVHLKAKVFKHEWPQEKAEQKAVHHSINDMLVVHRTLPNPDFLPFSQECPLSVRNVNRKHTSLGPAQN